MSLYGIVLVVSFVFMLVLVIFVLFTINVRHEKVNGRYMHAWFIPLPGWKTGYYPEQIISGKEWIGTKDKNLTATVGGKRNPEIEALIALKTLGLYQDQDYELRELDGHWVLYRKAKEVNYFSLSAFYRVSPWKLSSDLNKTYS